MNAIYELDTASTYGVLFRTAVKGMERTPMVPNNEKIETIVRFPIMISVIHAIRGDDLSQCKILVGDVDVTTTSDVLVRPKMRVSDDLRWVQRAVIVLIRGCLGWRLCIPVGKEVASRFANTQPMLGNTVTNPRPSLHVRLHGKRVDYVRRSTEHPHHTHTNGPTIRRHAPSIGPSAPSTTCLFQ